MKKQTLVKSLLILLPILAVGLATTRDSVIVFDTATGVTEYYSYFDLAPLEKLQMLPPLAAMLSFASGICAAVWLATKKDWSLKGIFGTSFAAATAAGIPVMIQETVRMVPNVGLPIFMIIQCLIAYHYIKHPAEAEDKKAPRKIKR